MLFLIVPLCLILIAFGFGMLFLVWASRHDGMGVNLAKTAGYIIVILAAIAFVCGTVSIVKFSHAMSQMPAKPAVMMHR